MTTESPAAAPSAPGQDKGGGKAMQNMQRFGRSLMLPIVAVRAGLLLPLGQDDLLLLFAVDP